MQIEEVAWSHPHLIGQVLSAVSQVKACLGRECSEERWEREDKYFVLALPSEKTAGRRPKEDRQKDS